MQRTSRSDWIRGEGPGGGSQRLRRRVPDGGLRSPLHPGHPLCGSPAQGSDPALCGRADVGSSRHADELRGQAGAQTAR